MEFSINEFYTSEEDLVPILSALEEHSSTKCRTNIIFKLTGGCSPLLYDQRSRLLALCQSFSITLDCLDVSEKMEFYLELKPDILKLKDCKISKALPNSLHLVALHISENKSPFKLIPLLNFNILKVFELRDLEIQQILDSKYKIASIINS